MLTLNMPLVEAFINGGTYTGITYEKQNSQTKYYLGADSSRFKKNGLWYAEFTMALCVHRHTAGGMGMGSKIFGEAITERDYDQVKNRPSMRLMRECVLLSEFFMKLQHLLVDKDYVELHLDLNRKKGTGSNFMVEQAVGYLRGVCGHAAVVCSKPDSPAASFVADRLTEILRQMWSAKESGARKPPTLEQLLEFLRAPFPPPKKYPHQIIVSGGVYQWMMKYQKKTK